MNVVYISYEFNKIQYTWFCYLNTIFNLPYLCNGGVDERDL